MRHARHPWQTIGLLVGGLCLANVSITPAVAAPVMYTFTGVVAGIDSALTSPLPLSKPAPLPKVSRSKNRFVTQLAKSNRLATNLGSLVQVNVGSYQVHLPFRAKDRRGDSSTPDFSKATHLSSSKDGLIFIPRSSVTSWLSQSSSRTVEEATSIFRTTALPEPSELPPSIGAFSHSSQLRLPFKSEAAHPNPVTIVQGTILPATGVPLPASLIIAGVGLVALISLGAGGLRTN